MSSLREEAGALLSLALPMMIAQGGLMTMGLVDSLMIGRVSSLQMGAVSLGNSVAGVIVVLGIGLAMGIEPLVSQAYGAREHQTAHRWLWQGVWLSVFTAIPLSLLIVLSSLLFEPFGVPADIDRVTTGYLWARLPGVAFNTVYSTFRSYLTGVGRTRPIVVAVVVANLVNAGIDAVLIFGLGLGAVGIGLATSASWMLMFAIAFYAVHVSEGRTVGFVTPERTEILEVTRLGWPIGLQLVVEVGIFATVSLLIAPFGEAALAGHQIAIALASATFMCAVGVGVASTARVGHHIGALRSELARRTGLLAMLLGAGFMGAGGLLFLLFAEPLARLFAPTDPEAVAIGATLLRVAAVFSISDGIQVVAAGALRGAGDTKWPFVANAVAHWLIGLPLALLLGRTFGMGPVGFWWGLTAGLTVTALILAGRFWVLSRKPIARL